MLHARVQAKLHLSAFSVTPSAPSLRDRLPAGVRNVAMPAVHIADPKREQIAPALPSLHSNYGLCAPRSANSNVQMLCCLSRHIQPPFF